MSSTNTALWSPAPPGRCTLPVPGACDSSPRLAQTTPQSDARQRCIASRACGADKQDRHRVEFPPNGATFQKTYRGFVLGWGSRPCAQTGSQCRVSCVSSHAYTARASHARLAGRYTPSSTEPAFSNGNQTGFQIDIGSREAKHFPDEHTCGVQEKNKHPQSSRINTATTKFLTRSRFAEQGTDLTLFVDVGDECLLDGWANSRHRRRLKHPARSPILEKMP